MTDTFFTDGEAYERFMGRWSRAVGEIFLDWLALPQDQKWLDVGCGTGAFTELVHARCRPSQIDGIDPAGDQIEFARKKPIGSQARFQVGDSQALPYADREFDAAAMALVISFIPDAGKAVAEMARVLKPGGTGGAYMWDFYGNGFTQQPLRAAMEAANVTVPPNPRTENSTREAMTQFFEKAGFTNVTTRTIEIEVAYRDFDDYWSSQTALPNPAVLALRKLPEADIAKIQADLRGRLATADGSIRYGARANAVKGRISQ